MNKKTYTVALFAAIVGFSLPALADQYRIVVDAGSSGSRVHLFSYDLSTSVPSIKESFQAKSKVGLATFAQDPQDAGASLKPALDAVTKYLNDKQIDPATVPVQVLGTAGMRLIDAGAQDAIYDNVKSYVRTYKLAVDDKASAFETIPGQMEGLYGWLDINYLSGNFPGKPEATVGSIDMGGASTQLAFATQDTSKQADELDMIIGGQKYHVFSKSFLGLGEDQARNTIDQNEKSAAGCYPVNDVIWSKDQKTSGSFNFGNCGSLYSNLIDSNKVKDNILPVGNQNFIAYSGAYYAFNFFGVDTTPDQNSLTNSITKVCNQSWEQLQKNYPTVDPKYLSAYCANGLYLDDLFYGANAYQMQGSQLRVLSQLKDQQGKLQDIDWPLGAVLFSLVSNSVS